MIVCWKYTYLMTNHIYNCKYSKSILLTKWTCSAVDHTITLQQLYLTDTKSWQLMLTDAKSWQLRLIDAKILGNFSSPIQSRGNFISPIQSRDSLSHRYKVVAVYLIDTKSWQLKLTDTESGQLMLSPSVYLDVRTDKRV